MCYIIFHIVGVIEYVLAYKLKRQYFNVYYVYLSTLFNFLSGALFFYEGKDV